MSDPMENLLYLRSVTERMGCLHELQLVQLKTWPMALFPNLVSCQIVPNTDKEIKTVEFNFSLNKKKKAPKDAKNRYLLLEQWVKTLLGDAWLIKIKVSNKVIYLGKRDVLRTTNKNKR